MSNKLASYFIAGALVSALALASRPLPGAVLVDGLHPNLLLFSFGKSSAGALLPRTCTTRA
jgi:hypothetical protein